tara:strand:- start:478 stop:705 length:228 start_codon:yes stop_codon:yes gene_type:complete
MDNNLQPIYSMLNSFVQSGKITDLRETYFNKIALPAMREVNSAWEPKTIQEAYIILKNYLNKEKSTKPNFFVDID